MVWIVKRKYWNDFLRCVSQKIFLPSQVRTFTHVSGPQTGLIPVSSLLYLLILHLRISLSQMKTILFSYMPVYFYLFY